MSVDVHLYRSRAATKNRCLMGSITNHWIKKTPQLSMFLLRASQVMPSQLIAVSLIYCASKRSCQILGLFLSLRRYNCVLHICSVQTCELLVADFKSTNNPCSKNHTSSTGGSQLQRSETTFSTAHHWLWSR